MDWSIGYTFEQANLEVNYTRAGAMSISELSLVAKPTILIPSPHVAEDHQTKNALSLVDRNAAIMIKDSEVVDALEGQISSVLENKGATKAMCAELRKAARPEACKVIVDEIEKLISDKS